MKLLNISKPFGEMAKILMSLEYIGKDLDTLGNDAEVVENPAHLMELLQLSGQKMMFLE